MTRHKVHSINSHTAESK